MTRKTWGAPKRAFYHCCTDVDRDESIAISADDGGDDVLKNACAFSPHVLESLFVLRDKARVDPMLAR